MTVKAPSAFWAAEECDDKQEQQWRAVLCCALFSDVELITHFFLLPKMYPPALMGCWILIPLHKKKIWAFILFRKQYSSYTKAFRVALHEMEKGIQRLFFFCKMAYVVVWKQVTPCNSVQRYLSIQELIQCCFTQSFMFPHLHLQIKLTFLLTPASFKGVWWLKKTLYWSHLV